MLISCTCSRGAAVEGFEGCKDEVFGLGAVKDEGVRVLVALVVALGVQMGWHLP